MRRIYAAVFGSGLGHVTRTHSIADRLRATQGKIEFLYSSFDEAFDYLKKCGEEVCYSPSVAVKWNMIGGFSGMDTFIRFPRELSNFSRQVVFEAEKISKFNPRVVLSDSRLSAAFAAKSMFYPVVTILNQLRILFPPRFRRGPFSAVLERIEADVLGLMWSFSDEILFPDLPPPYTIGEANISHIDVSNKVKFTGFMIPRLRINEDRLMKVRSLLQLDSRPVIFIQISGPLATKNAFLEPALMSSERLSRKYNVVISKGIPTGSPEPVRLTNGTLLYDWCPIKNELFLICDVLVARSGHTTISQCIDAGKPSVVIPIFNHSEQIWNAEKFARLGLGKTIKSEQLNAEILEKAVDQCIQDPAYKTNIERLKKISDRMDGLGETVNVIKAFL